MAIKRSSQIAFPEEEPEFQVAPMIDVLLVLMTFFMSITSTEVLKTKTKLDLVLAVAPDSKPKDIAQGEVIVNVAWNSVTQRGSIEFEEKTLNDPEDVTSVILRRKAGSKEFIRAVIRAGENVPYSFVHQVLAACADADVDNITFAVVDKTAAKGYGDKTKK